MRSTIANAVAVAHAAAAAVAGEPARYFAAGGSCEIVVTPARRASNDAGEDFAAVLSTEHDWLIDPAELVIDGSAILPEPGHFLQLEAGPVFVVVFQNGEDCWRWNDQFKQRYRVHTVEGAPRAEEQADE